MTARLSRIIGIATAALLTAGAAAAPPAGAVAGDSGTEHCIMDSGNGEQRCFATFPEAIAAATEGRVTDAPATVRTGTAGAEFRAEMKRFGASQSAAAGVVQGTFFDDGQFGGSSLTVYGSAPCKKDGWVEYQYDVSEDWKNRISSVQPWADCWIWLYPERGLGGDRDGPFKENTADIGTLMNDRTQSIGFS